MKNLRKLTKNVISLALIFCLIFGNVTTYAFTADKKSSKPKLPILNDVSNKKIKDDKIPKLKYIPSSNYIENSDEVLPFKFVSQLNENDEITTNIEFDESALNSNKIKVNLNKSDADEELVFNENLNGGVKSLELTGIEANAEYNYEVVITSPESDGETSKFYMGKYTLITKKASATQNICFIRDEVKNTNLTVGFRSPELDSLINNSIDKNVSIQSKDISSDVLTQASDENMANTFEEATEFNNLNLKDIASSSTINKYEVENNNSLSTANKLLDGDTVAGKISVSGDNDYYKVEFSNSGTMNVSLTYVPDNADYDLYFYNHQGDFVGFSRRAGKGVDEFISIDVEACRPFYIRVVGRSGSDFDSSQYYQLNVQWVPNPYLILDEHEPNNAINQSVMVQENPIYGTIHCPSDSDYFCIEVEELSDVSIVLFDNNHPQYTFDLLDSYDDIILCADSIEDNRSFIKTTLEPGIYFIEIYTATDYDRYDEYELSVSITPTSTINCKYILTENGYTIGITDEEDGVVKAVVTNSLTESGQVYELYGDIWQESDIQYAMIGNPDGDIIVAALDRTSMSILPDGLIDLDQIRSAIDELIFPIIGLNPDDYTQSEIENIRDGFGDAFDEDFCFGIGAYLFGDNYHPAWTDDYYYYLGKISTHNAILNYNAALLELATYQDGYSYLENLDVIDDMMYAYEQFGQYVITAHGELALESAEVYAASSSTAVSVAAGFGITALGHFNFATNNAANNLKNDVETAASKLQGSLSKGVVDHAIKRHYPEKVKDEIPYLLEKCSREQVDQILTANNRTYFNKNWTKEQIEEAITIAFDEAQSLNIVNDNHSITFLNETVTININRDGILKTAYGPHVYHLTDFELFYGGF